LAQQNTIKQLYLRRTLVRLGTICHFYLSTDLSKLLFRNVTKHNIKSLFDVFFYLILFNLFRSETFYR